MNVLKNPPFYSLAELVIKVHMFVRPCNILSVSIMGNSWYKNSSLIYADYSNLMNFKDWKKRPPTTCQIKNGSEQ